MRATLILIMCALTSCAVCERHPVVCSVAVSVVGSCIITTIAIHQAKRELQSEAAAAEGR